MNFFSAVLCTLFCTFVLMKIKRLTIYTNETMMIQEFFYLDYTFNTGTCFIKQIRIKTIIKRGKRSERKENLPNL